MKKINTKKYENIISSVLIDDREQDRKEYAMSQYEDLNPQISHLDVGDYIFNGYNGLQVCFEYKTGSDFLTSITNEENHLHNQVWEMMLSFEYRFVLVECESLKKEIDNKYYSTGIDISLGQINSNIATFNRFAPVIQVQTKYQAFDMMMRQAGKIIENKALLFAFGKKTTNTALNYLRSMKGLDSKAEVICNTLNLKTLQDLLTISYEDLKKVDGIGNATAKKILKDLGTYEHGTV